MTTYLCPECAAPCAAWEFGRHVLQCIRIRVGHVAAGQVAANDQREAYERERNAGRHGRVATPETPVPSGYGYGARPHKPTPPPGKTECHWCSELDYERCINCDGKGWV